MLKSLDLSIEKVSKGGILDEGNWILLPMGVGHDWRVEAKYSGIGRDYTVTSGEADSYFARFTGKTIFNNLIFAGEEMKILVTFQGSEGFDFAPSELDRICWNLFGHPLYGIVNARSMTDVDWEMVLPEELRYGKSHWLASRSGNIKLHGENEEEKADGKLGIHNIYNNMPIERSVCVENKGIYSLTASIRPMIHVRADNQTCGFAIDTLHNGETKEKAYVYKYLGKTVPLM